MLGFMPARNKRPVKLRLYLHPLQTLFCHPTLAYILLILQSLRASFKHAQKGFEITIYKKETFLKKWDIFGFEMLEWIGVNCQFHEMFFNVGVGECYFHRIFNLQSSVKINSTRVAFEERFEILVLLLTCMSYCSIVITIIMIGTHSDWSSLLQDLQKEKRSGELFKPSKKL